MVTSETDRMEALAIAWEAVSTLALADLADSLLYFVGRDEWNEAAAWIRSPNHHPPAPPEELVDWVREYVTVRTNRTLLPFVLEHDEAVERVVGAFDIRRSTASRLVSTALDGWEPA